MNNDVNTLPHDWAAYWREGQGTYFAFCNLYQAVNDCVWNGTLPNWALSLGCNVLVDNMVFFAKYYPDDGSLISVDLTHLSVAGLEMQELLEYVFAQLTYASCKIQAERFNRREEADVLFIAKASLLGYVGNPIYGQAKKGGLANCIIAKFIADGFAANFDLRKYCTAYKSMPAAGSVKAVAMWNALDASSKFSIEPNMTLAKAQNDGVCDYEDVVSETKQGNVSCGIDMEKFRALPTSDRLRLMRYQKSLISKENCGGFELIDWISLTEIQPSCKDWWPYKSFAKMPPHCWTRYILLFPDQASRCPYDQLHGRDWALFLRKDSAYADKCDFSRFAESDWVDLLSQCPGYASRCDISKYEGKDRLRIIKEAPALATDVDVQAFSTLDFSIAIKRDPSFVDRLNINNLPVAFRVLILQNRSELIDEVNTSDFSGQEWIAVIKKQRSLLSKCNFNELDEYDWFCLMEMGVDVCDICKWERLKGDFWVSVLLHPQLRKAYGKYCNFNLLSERNWSELLETRWDFAWECPCLDRISKEARKVLFCNSYFFRKLIRSDDFTSADWVEIIDKDPDLYSECDITSLSERQQLFVEYRVCQNYWHCGYEDRENEEEKAEYRRKMNEYLDDYKGFVELKRGDNSKQELVAGWRMWFSNEGVAESDTDRYILCEPIECDYYNGVGKVRAHKDDQPEIDGCYHKCYRLTLDPDVEAPANVIAIEPCDDLYNAITDEFVSTESCDNNE